MTTTTFVGAKGGVGTSTVAVIHALELAARTGTVHLSATDSSVIDDLAAILGVPAPADGEAVVAAPGLTLGDEPDPNAHCVVDAGTDTFSDHHGDVYLVLRNDYLSLRRALNAPRSAIGAVLVSEPKRALTRTDVAAVIACPVVVELAVTPEIARVIDAGLIVSSRRRRLGIPVIPQATPIR
jgi:hypothetical protein